VGIIYGSHLETLKESIYSECARRANLKNDLYPDYNYYINLLDNANTSGII
jgi:hypothetical protein